jgi:hypothetical protein
VKTSHRETRLVKEGGKWGKRLEVWPALQCDWCGRNEIMFGDDKPLWWFLELRRSDDPTDPWTFCSAHCVARWTAEPGREREGLRWRDRLKGFRR